MRKGQQPRRPYCGRRSRRKGQSLMKTLGGTLIQIRRKLKAAVRQVTRGKTRERRRHSAPQFFRTMEISQRK